MQPRVARLGLLHSYCGRSQRTQKVGGNRAGDSQAREGIRVEGKVSISRRSWTTKLKIKPKINYT